MSRLLITAVGKHPDVQPVVRPGTTWFYQCHACGTRSIDFDPCSDFAREAAIQNLSNKPCDYSSRIPIAFTAQG